jgi:hypothetical protein
MSYIARFFKWIFQTLWKLVKEIAMFATKQVLTFLRFSFPYVVRVIGLGFKVAMQLSVLGFLSLIRPVPEISIQLGKEWSDRAVRNLKFPTLHQIALTRLLTVVAFLTIFVGYLLDVFTMAFTVVWLWENGDWLLSLVH